MTLLRYFWKFCLEKGMRKKLTSPKSYYVWWEAISSQKTMGVGRILVPFCRHSDCKERWSQRPCHIASKSLNQDSNPTVSSSILCFLYTSTASLNIQRQNISPCLHLAFIFSGVNCLFITLLGSWSFFYKFRLALYMP